jgi:cold shock CspA family protein
VQATVSEFDPESASGSLVTDEGVLVPFDATAFDRSGLVRLRPGQRLIVVTEGEGADLRATALRLENVAVVPVTQPHRS